MALRIRAYEILGSLWVILAAAREQAPATNEQPWASILYTAVVRGKVALPCDISPPSADDGVALILWYKDEAPSPIYTLDARRGTVEQARQSAVSILDNRAYFNMINRPAFLQLDPVQEEDAGEYRCRVDFHKARTVNTVITLKVIVPPPEPVIYDKEKRQVKGLVGPYNEGEGLRLTCETDGGKPRPAVTWWREYSLIDDTYTFVTGDNSVRNDLEIKELQRHDLLAVLTCQASNNNITVPASSSITLDLNLKPLSVKLEPYKQSLSANQDMEIKCTASGSRPAATISWWKGSEQLKSTHKEERQGEVTTSILHFSPSVDDNGKFLSCRAENHLISNSDLEEGWKLEVHYSPQVTIQLGSTLKKGEIQEGNDVYFECNIRANPWVSEVAWQFNGQEIRTNTSAGIVISNQSLVLQKVRRTHRGQYSCVATNTEGEGRSTDIYLTIRYAPVCKAGTRRVYGVSRHESVRVICEVDADPSDVMFHWSFNNSEKSMDVISFSSEGRESTATYMPHTEEDYGSLICLGTNEVGRQREACIFSVVPAGPPEALHNCTVLNHTEESIHVECIEGYNGGLPQSFTIEVYGVEHQSLKKNVTSLQPLFFVQGLPSGTNLHLVLYSGNTKGRSPPVTLSATTLQRAEKLTGMQGIIIIRPVLGLLIGVVIALVIIAIVIVISMKIKKKRKQKEAQRTSTTSDKSQTPLKKDTDDMPDGEEKGPDIIPANIINRAYYTEETTKDNSSPSSGAVASSRVWSETPRQESVEPSLTSSTYLKPEDITYVELSLPREHHNTGSVSVRRKEPPTEYAKIDLHSHLHLQTIAGERDEEEELGSNTCETPLMSSRRESAV